MSITKRMNLMIRSRVTKIVIQNSTGDVWISIGGTGKCGDLHDHLELHLTNQCGAYIDKYCNDLLFRRYLSNICQQHMIICLASTGTLTNVTKDGSSTRRILYDSSWNGNEGSCFNTDEVSFRIIYIFSSYM